MKHAMTAALLALVGALILVGGYYLSERTREPSKQMIQAAQARSFWGARPKWLEFTDKSELFKRVRDRAYAYCFSSGEIETACAQQQDDAVQDAVLTLLIVGDQQRMRDKEKLGTKEYWVATHPEIAARVAKSCWALYIEHGASDARILSVCLGNLTDYSPLVDLPVP